MNRYEKEGSQFDDDKSIFASILKEKWKMIPVSSWMRILIRDDNR